MKVQELINENIWKIILICLSRALGFEDNKGSKIRKFSQQYDNRTNEHVIYLEYRVVSNGNGIPREKSEKLAKNDQVVLKKIGKMVGRLVD